MFSNHLTILLVESATKKAISFRSSVSWGLLSVQVDGPGEVVCDDVYHILAVGM